jgi:membrane-bound serine protease (ClpP class)
MMTLCTFCETGFAQGFVYHVRINTEIDLGVAPYIRRVIDDAEKKGASAIIFEVNTFGGRVDAATQIKDAIIHSPVRTIAYVNDRAVSAGALISLSCEKIVMHAGSVIGASTVVDGEGKKQSEKYQAYMRSEMRSTAERYGRRKDIAEGMVDEKVQVEQLNPDGNKLISLTALEAKNFGICDTILNNEQQILSYIGLPNAQVIVLESNWAEKFVGFLNQPFVSSILIIIGLIGIFTELKSPGLGFPVVAGIIAFSLFFGSSYILQLASVWEIVAFILGLALLALEIFVIPGFGVTGILGIGLMIGSIFFSLFSSGPDMATSIQYAIVQLAVSLLITGLLVSLLIRYLPKSDRFKKLTLQTANASGAGFVASSNYGELLGKHGQSLTPLRPAGTVEISGEKYDVIADGDFINKNESVQVISVEGRKIKVSRVRE